MIGFGDLHMSLKKPKAIKDSFNWEEHVVNVLESIAETANKRHSSVFIAGDVFDTAQPSYRTVNVFKTHLVDFVDGKVFAVPGNHDLPNHRYDRVDNSAFALCGVTDISGDEKYLGLPWGKDLYDIEDIGFRRCGIAHYPLYMDEKLYPDMKDKYNIDRVFDAIQDKIECLFTGDTHYTFCIQKDKKLLDDTSIIANSGVILPRAIDMAGHKPCVGSYSALEGFEWIDVPNIPFESWKTDEHNQEKETKVQWESYVQNMTELEKVHLSFRKNLKEYVETNDVSDEVENILWESLGKEQ